MSSFSLGKYVPYDSWLHRLDPRLKIFFSLFFMVLVFLPFQRWAEAFLMDGVLLLLGIVLLWTSRMSIRQIFNSLSSLWFMVFLLLIIYVLVPNQSTHTLGIAWDLNGWVVYWDSFAQAGKIILRLLLMLIFTMVLTATTKPLDLTYALEWYMTPLKLVHFPAAEIAMTISIALRFIPTLLDDTTRVMKAQESRGVDFAHGKIWKRVKSLTSLIIPLFVSSFMRSEELAYAMETRCYDPQAKRTRYRKAHWGWSDTLVSFLGLLFSGGYIFLVVMNNNYGWQLFSIFGVYPQ